MPIIGTNAPRLLAAVAAVLLAGCEQATGSHADARPRPEAVFGQAAAALTPQERAALIDMADRVQREPAGTPALPPAGHPLEGLTEAQINELFSAAGLSPEPYLPTGFQFCKVDCGERGAP